jgi:hypothetical protein
MKKSYFELTYSVPHLNKPSIVDAVVYNKAGKYSVMFKESVNNIGMSLTNGIEYAVIALSKKLGIHPENLQVFQLDVERDQYDYVQFKDGNPQWLAFDNSDILPMLIDWMQLTEEEEQSFYS